MNDGQAFLFSLRLNGQSSAIKFPVKHAHYAINCTATYGPTFGGGHDILSFKGTIHSSGNYFQSNGNYYFGHSYDMQGQNANNINNGHVQYKDIEVYQVQDSAEGNVCSNILKTLKINLWDIIIDVTSMDHRFNIYSNI